MDIKAIARQAVQRRAQARSRLAGLGWGGYFSSGEDADIAEAEKLRVDLDNAVSIMNADAADAPEGSALQRNVPAYVGALAHALQYMPTPTQVEVKVRAGGTDRENLGKQVAAWEALLKSRMGMFQADQKDASGQASLNIAQKEFVEVSADAAKRDQNAVFWSKVTDINNPFSPIGILGTIKTYAIWGLVIGGAILAAPHLLRAWGAYRTTKHQTSAAGLGIKANRRR